MLRKTFNLKSKLLWLPLFLLLGFLQQISAQQYVIYPSYCIYQGASYHIGHPSDWDFYDCNPSHIVKWKVYNEECELESVSYGPDSPDCLCGGTLQVKIMRFLCQTVCEEIALPPCRKKGGGSIFRTEDPKGGEPLVESAESCELPCQGDYSGENCEEFSVELTNVSYCFAGGMSGTIISSATGETFDCMDNAFVYWRHHIPNPEYPGNSTSQFIVNAFGFGSDFGTCLCGGQLQVRVRNACCEISDFYFETGTCPDDDIGSFRPSSPSNGLSQQKAKLFPNPVTTGFFNLSLEETKEIDAELQMFNQSGKLVKTIRVTGTDTSVDVSHLTPGVYWINVRGSANFSEKVIVH